MAKNLVAGLSQFSLSKSLLVFALLMASAVGALLLTPNLQSTKTVPNFEKIIPKQFADWKEIPASFTQVSLSTGTNDLVNQLYDQVLLRTYMNSKGDKVMLALAYAREQKQDIKIHRPEICYIAQGFKVLSKKHHVINISPNKFIPAERLLANNQSRNEAVSYWIRIGDQYPKDGMAARLQIFREGLKGKILDGILVRASTTLNDDNGALIAFDTQEKFLIELISALEDKEKGLLI